MTAMANMGNLVVALPPSDIWLTDEQAADFLGYANTYFLDLARMIGHKDLRSLMVYYNATASEIANRLD